MTVTWVSVTMMSRLGIKVFSAPVMYSPVLVMSSTSISTM